MTTVKEMAQQLFDAFTTGKRKDGETFFKLEEDAPDWMSCIILDSHDSASMFPDDWRYAIIREMAGAIADATVEDDDLEEARDNIVPDIYTSDLTAWLHSRNDRVYYLTEALESGMDFKDGFKLLGYAQYLEKCEVFEQLLEALRSRATQEEEAA